MCKRCADVSGDPRKAAFQPIFTVTWITQQQAEQARQYTETNSNRTINLETQAVLTEDEALNIADVLEADPMVFRFTVDKSAVCLN